MPISVVCSCSAKLKVADAAAGKRVKCPKCGNPVAVPAPEPESDFEMVEDEPAPPPRKKPRVVDEDEDDAPPPKRKPAPLEVDEAVDDDEEEEKPRRKSRVDDEEEEDEDEKPRKKGKGKGGKKKAKAKSNLPLLLGVGGGALLLVIVGVVVTLVVMNQPQNTAKTGTNAGGPAGNGLPAGWSTYKGEGFSIDVPDSAKFELKPVAGQQQKTWGSAGGGGPPPPGQYAYMVNFTEMPAETKQLLDDNPNMLSSFVKIAMMKDTSAFGPGTKLESDKKVTFGGREAIQVTLKGPQVGGYLRFYYHKGKLFILGAMAQTLPDENDVAVKTFLDSFKPE